MRSSSEVVDHGTAARPGHVGRPPTVTRVMQAAATYSSTLESLEIYVLLYSETTACRIYSSSPLCLSRCSLEGIITPPSLISGDACFAWQLDQELACRLTGEGPQSFRPHSFETLTATWHPQHRPPRLPGALRLQAAAWRAKRHETGVTIRVRSGVGCS